MSDVINWWWLHGFHLKKFRMKDLLFYSGWFFESNYHLINI